ncbi:MAG: HNH endonuclease [Bacteroidetes bacterium]|nr:MAG: HNH endonuclease [Bacteroidota bacterium]REK06580.1 MAG: HNH endonuclease [Bacteroidota bacterium]REK33346.1 MAG: HNH endonuclease [Bacteroidota bacterium]REK49746.1 MAG: HNH endonuclease [Bacteroidota bacterium]
MGNFHLDKNGYPRWDDNDGLVHRSVAAKMVGGKIYNNMVVHHKDGNKANFRKSNLVIMTRSEHAKLHAAERKRK